MNPVILAPSLLSADFGNMAGGLSLIKDSGGDWIHLDVMDGSFVPNITFGNKMVSDLRSKSDLPFDVHLMVNHPETFIEPFADAGADYITVHLEASTHLHRLLNSIRATGSKVGISIVPSTPVCLLTEVLPLIDLILIMTVNPGFGGQVMIESCLDKVATLKEIKLRENYQFLIEVDGGINEKTYATAISAGAEVLVMGSSFFSSPDPKKFIARIRGGRSGQYITK